MVGFETDVEVVLSRRLSLFDEKSKQSQINLGGNDSTTYVVLVFLVLLLSRSVVVSTVSVS